MLFTSSHEKSSKDIFLFCLNKTKFPKDAGFFILTDQYAKCLKEATKYEQYCSNSQKDCFKNLWWDAHQKAKKEKNLTFVNTLIS